MMLKLAGLAILLGCFVAPSQAQRQERNEYKCHFVLVGGLEVIRYMTSPIKTAKTFARSLSPYIYAKDGETRLAIEQVKECVKADDKFDSFDAKQLDKRTLS